MREPEGDGWPAIFVQCAYLTDKTKPDQPSALTHLWRSKGLYFFLSACLIGQILNAFIYATVAVLQGNWEILLPLMLFHLPHLAHDILSPKGSPDEKIRFPLYKHPKDPWQITENPGVPAVMLSHPALRIQQGGISYSPSLRDNWNAFRSYSCECIEDLYFRLHFVYNRPSLRARLSGLATKCIYAIPFLLTFGLFIYGYSRFGWRADVNLTLRIVLIYIVFFLTDVGSKIGKQRTLDVLVGGQTVTEAELTAFLDGQLPRTERL